MADFFILNESMEVSPFSDFLVGMTSLVSIDKEKEDSFYKHSSLYSTDNYLKLCESFGQVEQVISGFIEQLSPCEKYLDTEVKLETHFAPNDSAFLGIDFRSTSINSEMQITNNEIYKNFKSTKLWDVNYRNLWDRREKLFENIVLCGEVEQQIIQLGNSSHFNQVLERLKELDRACAGWNDGDFNYREVNSNYSLRISPESNQTMAQYGNQRTFRLPDGSTEKFELHIKTGDLRFHFYAENSSKTVYVGYIGAHLDTVSN